MIIKLFNFLHQDKICHAPGEIFIEANSMLLVWMFIIFILDQLLCKKYKGRYFALHAIVNLCLIPFLAFPDIFTFYNNILLGKYRCIYMWKQTCINRICRITYVSYIMFQIKNDRYNTSYSCINWWIRRNVV